MKHKACNKKVVKSDLPQYEYLCKFCDENLFIFEVVNPQIIEYKTL